MKEVIKNRSEILFLYDIRDANPNGDPVDENRPRIDTETGINIVTDVRLKRTIRDYFVDLFVDLFDTKKPRIAGRDVFVRERRDEEGFLLDAKNAAKEVLLEKDDKQSKTSAENSTEEDKQSKPSIKNKFCEKYIDIRLFGGIIPIELDLKNSDGKSSKNNPKDNARKSTKKGEKVEQTKIIYEEASTERDEVTNNDKISEKEGDTEEDEITSKIKHNVIALTGPVQFKYGRSLHKVDGPIFIKGTGAFADKYDRNNKKLQFTFREEYILHYSLICFYGIINENAAKHTGLTYDDVDLLMEAMWNGTKNLISRSKVGQMPRLLLQVVYKGGNFHIGELDRRICLKSKDGGEITTPESIRDISEVKLDITDLVDALNRNKDKIERVRIKVDDRIAFVKNGIDVDIYSALSGLTVEDFTFKPEIRHEGSSS